MGVLRPRLTLFAIALALLAGCGQSRQAGSGPVGIIPAPSGGAVGNGGDYLTALFEEGRIFAAGILARSRPERFPPALQSYLSLEERNWLFAHRLDLADDIRHSPHLPPVTTAPSSDFVCAFTRPEPRAPIGLLEKCIENVGHSRQAAAVVLIHESVHHLLGADESAAYHIATTVGLWWIYQGHPEAPHWVESAPEHLTYRMFRWGYGHSTWTGSELVTWLGDEIRYYNPSTDEWRMVKALNDYLDWVIPRPTQENINLPLKQSDAGDWVAGRVVAFSQCAADRRTKGVGHSYDPKTNRWEEIPAEGAPSSRMSFVHLSLGDRLLIWGGMSCAKRTRNGEESFAFYNDGAIYDPVSRRWSPLPVSGWIPEGRTRPAIAFTGNKLYLWGGGGSASPWEGEPYRLVKRLQDGAVYDFGTARWEKLPETGAPPRNYAPQGLWLTDRFLVLSPDEEGDRQGAIFDPKARAWLPLPKTNRPKLGRFELNPLGLLSTGGEAILINDDEVAFFTPDENRWQTFTKLLQPDPIWNTLYGHWTGEPMEVYWTGVEVLRWDHQANRLFILYP